MCLTCTPVVSVTYVTDRRHDGTVTWHGQAHSRKAANQQPIQMSFLKYAPRSKPCRPRFSAVRGKSSTPVGLRSLARATCTFLASTPAAILKSKQARRSAQIWSGSGKDRTGGQITPMRVGTEHHQGRGAWPRGFCTCSRRLVSIRERCRPATSSSCGRRRKRRSWQTRKLCFSHAGPSTRRSLRLCKSGSYSVSVALPAARFENASAPENTSTASRRRTAADGGAKRTPLAMAEWWSR